MPVDAALGVAGRMPGPVGGLAGEATGQLPGFLLPLGFGLGLGGCRFGGEFSLELGRGGGLLGVDGGLFEGEKNLDHGVVE
jgi:hypothetical protein